MTKVSTISLSDDAVLMLNKIRSNDINFNFSAYISRCLEKALKEQTDNKDDPNILNKELQSNEQRIKELQEEKNKIESKLLEKKLEEELTILEEAKHQEKLQKDREFKLEFRTNQILELYDVDYSEAYNIAIESIDKHLNPIELCELKQLPKKLIDKNGIQG